MSTSTWRLRDRVAAFLASSQEGAARRAVLRTALCAWLHRLWRRRAGNSRERDLFALELRLDRSIGRSVGLIGRPARLIGLIGRSDRSDYQVLSSQKSTFFNFFGTNSAANLASRTPPRDARHAGGTFREVQCLGGPAGWHSD